MNKILKHVNDSKKEISLVFFPSKKQIKSALFNVITMVSVVAIFILAIDYIMTNALTAFLR